MADEEAAETGLACPNWQLRTANWELQTANRKLQTANCKMRIADCGEISFPISATHTTVANSRITNAEFSARLLDAAVRVGKVADALPDTRLGRHVSGQLVRCGTSALPNYEEACAAESRRDFVHKLSISLKELRETRGWLQFIIKAELLPEARLTGLVDEVSQLMSMVAASIVTAKTNGRRRTAADDAE